MRRILSLCFLLVILSACYEEQTGCLDLTAANFDAAADNDCIEDDNSPTNCPCAYNHLNFEVDFIFQDSLNINFDTAFVNNLGDTILVNSAYFVFSDFSAISETGSAFTVQNFADFNNDSVLNEVNDLVVSKLGGINTNVGTMHFSALVKQANFKLGITTESNNATLNFEDNESIETIVDSMYFNSENELAFARLEVSQINVDTNDYVFNFYDQMDMVNIEFEFDTLIQYHHNLQIELEADIFVLFEDVNLEAADAQTQLVSNFNRFMKQKE